MIYKDKGLLNDFDSTYFCVLVIDFLKSIGEEPDEENVKGIIDFIIDNMSSKGSNLLSKRAGFLISHIYEKLSSRGSHCYIGQNFISILLRLSCHCLTWSRS